jgi:hypothetical protein
MTEVRIFFAFILIACLSGCAALSQPENKFAARSVTRATTAYLIERAAPEDRDARRERIRAIANDILAASKADEAATVPALKALLQSKVHWENLSLPEVSLVNDLIDLAEANLTAGIGEANIPPDQLILLGDFCSWVIEATYLGVQQ